MCWSWEAATNHDGAALAQPDPGRGKYERPGTREPIRQPRSKIALVPNMRQIKICRALQDQFFDWSAARCTAAKLAITNTTRRIAHIKVCQSGN